MAKLYLFAIGGTGARVLRSLTMLLASGLQIPRHIDTIVPILIDPDISNGDLNRTTALLNNYQEIKKRVGPDSGFFDLEVKTLSQLSDVQTATLSDNFTYNINNDQNQKFHHYIGYHSLSEEDRSFVDLLFSDQNLQAEMDVGFKGNPNIGSVVLNQFTQSPEFDHFVTSFSQGDMIFVISSIFGGTGAAGFPLILKNLRNLQIEAGNAGLIRDSVIGAITYLPYFKLSNPKEHKSEVNSATFLQKAKAALSYYQHNLTGNNSLNAMYYIGDYSNNIYDNFDGKAQQINKAHFLEVAGALGILDYIENSSRYETSNGKARNTIFKEFGIDDAKRTLTFKDLGTRTINRLAYPLSSFYLFASYLNDGLPKAIKNGKVPWIRKGVGKGFFEEGFYKKQVKEFTDAFLTWVEELKRNEVAFSPFNDNVHDKNFLEFIRAYPAKKKYFFQNYHLKRLDGKANQLYKKYRNDTQDLAFIKLFTESANKLLRETYKLN